MGGVQKILAQNIEVNVSKLPKIKVSYNWIGVPAAPGADESNSGPLQKVSTYNLNNEKDYEKLVFYNNNYGLGITVGKEVLIP